MSRLTRGGTGVISVPAPPLGGELGDFPGTRPGRLPVRTRRVPNAQRSVGQFARQPVLRRAKPWSRLDWADREILGALTRLLP